MEPSLRHVLPQELLEQMGWVRSLARSLVHDPNTADDLAQDAWVQAVQRPPERAVGGPGLRAWLASMTRSLARQSNRSQVNRGLRERAVARTEAQPSTAEVVERGALHQRLVEAVMGLDEPYRSTILLRFLDGLSAAEIAERTGASSPGVRQRLSRGLEQLRGRLDREFRGDRSAWASVLLRLSQSGGSPSGAVPIPAPGTGGALALARSASVLGASKVLGAIGIGTVLVIATMFVVEKATKPESESARPQLARVDPPAGHEEELSKPANSAQDDRQSLAAPTKSDPSLPGSSESPSESTDATLIVHVVARETGAPLPGMGVTLSPSKGSFTSVFVDRAKGKLGESLKSDAEGTVEYKFAYPNALHLRASDEGERVGQAELEIPALTTRENRTVRVELPTRDDLDFHGQVLSREDHHGVVGSHVRLIRLQWLADGQGWKDMPFAASDSDSDGRFEFRTATWKDPHIRVEADGFASVIVSPGPGHDTLESAFSVLLDRAASVVARVIDSRGSVVAGAGVLLKTQARRIMQPRESAFLSDLGFPDPEWSATTTSDGSCRLDGLVPDAPIEVEIRVPDHSPQKMDPPLTLKPGEIREIDWHIGGGCTLTGAVYDQQNTPVAKLELWLVRARTERARFLELVDEVSGVIKTTTDDTGHYSFSSIAAGTWSIGAAPTRYGPKAVDSSLVAPMSSVVTIQPDARTASFDLRVQRGIYICGRIFDLLGTPTTGWVSAFQSGIPTGLNSEASEDGGFVLGPLVLGQYDLVAMGSDNTSMSKPVPASAGDEKVILHLPPGGTVSGRVVILESQEPCQAVIIVANRDSSDLGILTGGTAGDGVFHIGGFKPGIYDVTAKTRGGLVGVARGVSIAGGSETKDLVVKVEPGGRIRVRYTGSAPRAFFRIIQDQSAIAGGTLQGHDGSVELVPAGKMTVSLLVNSHEKPREKAIEVTVGEEKEVVFEDGN